MIMIIYIKKGFKCRNHCAPEVSRLSDQFVCFFLPFSLCKVNCVCVVCDAFTPLGESKVLLDSGFHALDSGFHVLYMFLLMELVIWIPVVGGILQEQERFSLIPNSTGN